MHAGRIPDRFGKATGWRCNANGSRANLDTQKESRVADSDIRSKPQTQQKRYDSSLSSFLNGPFLVYRTLELRDGSLMQVVPTKKRDLRSAECCDTRSCGADA